MAGHAPAALRKLTLRRLQALALVLDLAAIVLFAVVPAHAYGWMAEMDPTLGSLPEDPNRDVRLLLTGAALAAAAGLNLYLAARGRGAWRVANGLLAAVLAGFWAVRFLL